MTKNYIYQLRKYKGRSSRLTCPKCGKPHSFSPYVDANDNIIDPSVGRCNRESKCGYHYPPHAYFEDHKSHDSNWSNKSYKSCTKQYTSKVMPTEQINVIPYDYVTRSIRPEIDSDFTFFLKSFMTIDMVNHIIDEYKIGVTASHDVIFFQIDQKGRCRTGKIMKYDKTTGHRIKDPNQPGLINWVHADLKRGNNLPRDWYVTQCLYGEHLLYKYPDKTVALVEAEKTAVICAAFMPDFVWIAVGGKSQLNDRVRVLAGRRVIAFPDLDAIDDWKARAAKYPELGISISSLIKTKNNATYNSDIADWIIDWALDKKQGEDFTK